MTARPTSPSPIAIRHASADDRTELGRLATQLGYPDFSADDLLWILTVGAAEQVVLVAEQTEPTKQVDAAPRLAGFIHLRQLRSLLVAGMVDVGGLVVDTELRGGGVGGALIAAAVAWSRAQGARLLQARSGSQRIEAHGFYRRRGFILVKEQLVFHLPL